MNPVEFHPYTSSVQERIFQMESHGNKELEELRHDLISKFKDAGIQCANDNKIVFELEYNGKHIFYGFYDGVFSIGFGLRHA